MRAVKQVLDFVSSATAPRQPLLGNCSSITAPRQLLLRCSTYGLPALMRYFRSPFLTRLYRFLPWNRTYGLPALMHYSRQLPRALFSVSVPDSTLPTPSLESYLQPSMVSYHLYPYRRESPCHLPPCKRLGVHHMAEVVKFFYYIAGRQSNSINANIYYTHYNALREFDNLCYILI